MIARLLSSCLGWSAIKRQLRLDRNCNDPLSNISQVSKPKSIPGGKEKFRSRVSAAF